MKLKPLPPEVRALLRDAPPRLIAHLTLVHHTAHGLTRQLKRTFPKLDFDRELVLFGAATHDIGKLRHPEELSGPGLAHERAGQSLLREAGYSDAQARFAFTHGKGNATTLEDQLVRVSDLLWKGKRDEEVEGELVDTLSNQLAEDRWEVYARLDELLSTLSAGADQRLAFHAAVV